MPVSWSPPWAAVVVPNAVVSLVFILGCRNRTSSLLGCQSLGLPNALGHALVFLQEIMTNDRLWMYERMTENRVSPIFMSKVDEFINFTVAHETLSSPGDLKCPCTKYDNKPFRLHLYHRGFIPGYERWLCHGEEPELWGFTYGASTSNLSNVQSMPFPFRSMVEDAFGPAFMDF
ncbi:hypothetical protein Droror1_Dr00016319 [Drosera rotundifolia]